MLHDIHPLTIGDALHATTQQFPDKLALRDIHGDMTYRQLSEYSFGIANTLFRYNITTGDRIVLLLDQSITAVAAMLGCAQAGGCFIPVDVKEPVERLHYIINDCQPLLVLTDSNNEAAIKQALPQATVINIRGITPAAALDHTLEQASIVTPESAAYIFYTSGSTGNPKGVCQNHRNVLHFANTYATTLGIHADDILSMLYSMNFSASNMDIFSGLLRGASVIFYDLKNRGSAQLEQWLAAEKITVLHTVPSVFRHFLNNTSAGHCYSSIRAIDLGGEAVYNSDIHLLKTFFTPQCHCFNHLAATEASVIAQHKIDISIDTTNDITKTYTRGLLPVGPAAEGMAIKIVDTEGRPAAVNAIGEIILESDFLSTGYWQQAEQPGKAFGVTAEGKRYYRSGDLGFFDDNGELNYVGRNDFRVKINGQTIEPGEIEACLIALPAIQEAVVIAHQTTPDAEKVLLAFYIAKPGANLTSAVIRTALKAHLPGYMIPAHCIARPSFPKTSTGKVDRKNLVPLSDELEQVTDIIDLPETDLEKGIAAIFSSVLKITIIGKHQNFFELGGTSLTAMNLVTLLEKNYGATIPVELINNNASIIAIADYLQGEIEQSGQSSANTLSNTSGKYSSLLVPLKIHGQPRNLFLVHGRDGHAMVSPHFVELLSPNHCLYAIRARGLKQGEKPNLNIEGMAAEYIREIRAIQNEGPYFLAGLCAGSIVALEMARQLSRVGEIVKPVIVFDPPLRSLTPMPMDRKRLLLRDMYRSLQTYKMEDYRELAKGLEARIRDGKIDLDLNDEQALGATAHVVIGMNIAMNTYLPHPFDGEVLILCSKERFDNKRRFGDTLITGKMKHFIVGNSHDDVLDAKNPHFIAALKQSLSLMLNAPD